MTTNPPHNPLALREWFTEQGYPYPHLLSLPAQRELSRIIYRRIEYDNKQRITKPARTGHARFASILG